MKARDQISCHLRRVSLPARSFGLAAVAAVCVVIAPTPSQAITLGYQDNFAPGNGGFWIGGSLTGVQPSGGPGGTNDGYLRIVGDGGGPSGKITVHNGTPEWTGDYITAGVSRIEMDLKNFTTQSLTVRIGIKFFQSQGSPGYCTNNNKSFVLPADNLWHHAQFNLVATEMTPINGPTISLVEALSGGVNGFHELRILHSATPTLQGANLNGAMGVDNVTALPTPGSAGLLLAGAGVLAMRRFRRPPRDAAANGSPAPAAIADSN
jgi:hypothetical protein